MSDDARAIVVGAGLAGLAAAAALREVLGEVVLLERDPPAEAAPRHGTPQREQLHNLLYAAQQSLDRLLPGFCRRLRQAGAGEAKVAVETQVFELGERMPARDLGMRLMCAPRPLIERVARELLLEGGSVRVLDGARAVGLEVTGGKLLGAVVETGVGRRTLRAPIVIDASGARGSGRRWLREVGFEEPKATTLRVARWYASAEFERPSGAREEDRFWLVFPTHPTQRGGLVSPSAPRRWHVSLSGGFADPAPTSAAEMRTFAETLEVPWIADLLRDTRALGAPHVFRKPWAVWRHYEQLPHPLPGFLPVGDAVAALNPLFGQGMSVAAAQAVALADLFGGPGSEHELDRLTTAHHERVAAIVQSAWALGEMVDSPLPDGGVAGGPAALARRLRDSPELHRRYVAMWHLVEPAASVRSALEMQEALL